MAGAAAAMSDDQSLLLLNTFCYLRQQQKERQSYSLATTRCWLPASTSSGCLGPHNDQVRSGASQPLQELCKHT